jgi:hypothetical protein
MSALPRPDLAGPSRTLNDALHDLHHRAGWPSLRALARETGVSHTTVSKAFSRPALPTWGTLELLVEAMHGDLAHFHDLWLAASAPTDRARSPAPRIAGRRAELDAVRRHLETGSGLLLVTGEAGIGKSTLTGAAARTCAVVVATARCRPLSTPVPLMPVADLLRDLGVVDDASWSARVLGGCPRWVPPAIAPLLPELEVDAPPTLGTDFARQRLMSALVLLLDALRADRPLALVLDDLHWADPGTLDLLEMLASRGSSVPVVGTWRTADPDTGPDHLAWWERVGTRSPRVHLAPLSRDETAAQLALVDGTAPTRERVDRIFARSLGRPLFTEHLATTELSDDALPDALSVLLAKRLTGLGTDAWLLARTLGVADRSLTVDQLVQATGIDDDPTPALRTLVRQRIVSGHHDEVRLAHPLLGAAVRERLVPGEAARVHASVAEVLATLPDPPAAEVANHWRAAHRPEEELLWRVRAARSAEARFASREAYPEWTRARELCRTSVAVDGADRVSLAEVLVHRIDAAIRSGEDVDTVRVIIDDAMAEELPDTGRVEVLLRSADLECGFGDLDLGLRQLDESIDMHLRQPPSREAAHALETRINIRSSLGRHELTRDDIDHGLVIAREIDAPDVERLFRAQLAWLRLVDHEPEDAVRLARDAVAASDEEGDPVGSIRVAAYAAEVLLPAGARAEVVATVLAPAIRQAERWQLRGVFVDDVLSRTAEAHLREGAVDAAARVLASHVVGDLGTDLRRCQRVQAAVDLRRGDAGVALARLERITSIDNYAVAAASCDCTTADVHLWSGDPAAAAGCLDRALGFLGTDALALEAAAAFALHARTAADLADAARADDAGRAELRRQAEAVRAGSATDPFGPQAFGADLEAHTATWRNELDRLLVRDHAQSWVHAASLWDALHRPHDAAYCRWRAAQCALRDGQGTVAARLLRKAAADAREHAPLSRAIAGTAAR